MPKFIELRVTEDESSWMVLVNTASVGRVYPNPQNKLMSIVELNYHSINDAPVFLEVDTPYETLRQDFINMDSTD
jgi:hypothetical protein